MEDNAPFKLKSGNSPAFKMMGSAPAKHLALSHKKADHTPADHKARAETKKAERKAKWRGSKLYKGLSQLNEDLQSIGTDISKNERLGTEKKRKAEEAAAAAEVVEAPVVQEAPAEVVNLGATDDMKFGEAFSTARTTHGGKGGEFDWKGKKYHTGTAEEE